MKTYEVQIKTRHIIVNELWRAYSEEIYFGSAYPVVTINARSEKEAEEKAVAMVKSLPDRKDCVTFPLIPL